MQDMQKPGFQDRRAVTDAAFRASVTENLAAGSERMTRIETSLNANTAATNEMYELFSAMKGGFKVLEWLGRMAKWFAALVAGGAALAKIMGWQWPPFK